MVSVSKSKEFGSSMLAVYSKICHGLPNHVPYDIHGIARVGWLSLAHEVIISPTKQRCLTWETWCDMAWLVIHGWWFVGSFFEAASVSKSKEFGSFCGLWWNSSWLVISPYQMVWRGLAQPTHEPQAKVVMRELSFYNRLLNKRLFLWNLLIDFCKNNPLIIGLIMQPAIKQSLVGFIENLRYFLPDLSKIF